MCVLTPHASTTKVQQAPVIYSAPHVYLTPRVVQSTCTQRVTW